MKATLTGNLQEESSSILVERYLWFSEGESLMENDQL